MNFAPEERAAGCQKAIEALISTYSPEEVEAALMQVYRDKATQSEGRDANLHWFWLCRWAKAKAASIPSSEIVQALALHDKLTRS